MSERIEAAPTAAADDAIVIAGMAVEAPGGIDTPEDFFDALAAGADLIGPMPRDRDWPIDQVLALDDIAGWGAVPDAGGFLDGAAEFDPQFFGLSPREAAAMDPQQRVAMRVAWRAVENTGINPAALDGAEVGVFFGASAMEYGPRAAAVNEYSGHRIAGTALGSVSGRISHALGLTGPSMTVDTACASSLTAIHQAAAAVRSGECDWAIAGGVCVMGSPGAFFEFSRNNALAADGRCRSYSAGATGTVWGEGAGAVIIETAAAARAAGHRIYGVIAGSRVNHNGGGGPIVVPSAQAQRRVIEATIGAAGIDPASVDLIEGHGTGTLGDPMELSALADTYGAARSPQHPAAVGSVKSNAGHAQAASGVLGLIKVLLCGRHATIVASRFSDDPTDEIDWPTSGLRLATATEPWPARDGRRAAAVSSFGVSGTNAHLIVDMPEAVSV
ncbi:polyketide synthase [Gordonia neofelifaecis]|uniref:Putative polyketide synthase n=1 Tax=Gordonia neofelifaecis NRRL B-59395 TaxID=644548 RepID=F1YJM0_9ACTN|nr:polyketide synthase [Gordonia neofelifaecis]EGD54952.1 putative polyketide synthase [Gordonia neofelifaecis NRRL B-59395]